MYLRDFFFNLNFFYYFTSIYKQVQILMSLVGTDISRDVVFNVGEYRICNFFQNVHDIFGIKCKYCDKEVANLVSVYISFSNPFLWR